MAIFVDVEPRFDGEAGKRIAIDIREAVAKGVQDALEAFVLALSLAPDERVALEDYRAIRDASVKRARELLNGGV